jgi:cation transport ATPase
MIVAIFAFIDNTFRSPIVAAILYPVFVLLLSPMLAAVVMDFNSMSVILNALRLRSANLSCFDGSALKFH